MIEFERIVGGRLKVQPYKPNLEIQGRHFMEVDGKPFELKNEWGGSNAGCRYVIVCAIEQPFGLVEIEVFALDNVRIVARSDDLVPCKQLLEKEVAGLPHWAAREISTRDRTP